MGAVFAIDQCGVGGQAHGVQDGGGEVLRRDRVKIARSMAPPQRSSCCRTVLEQRDRVFRPSGGGSPKRRAHPCGGGFRASAQTASQFAVSGVSAARVRHGSEAVDIKHGQFVRRGLKDVAIVMGLHELALVGGRAPGRRDGRRLEQRDPARPSWRLCVGAARSGLWLCGRSRHESPRVGRARRADVRSISGDVRGSENSSARRGR